MATTLKTSPKTESVDLTGLPESVVVDIKRLVKTLQEKEAMAPGSMSVQLDMGFPQFLSRPDITFDEMERLLDEFSAMPTPHVLPSDFSRADIYDDDD